jgi:hypothetical protein
LARELTGQSLLQIARTFNRDLSTAIQALRRITELMDVDGKIAADVAACRALIEARKTIPYVGQLIYSRKECAAAVAFGNAVGRCS